MAKRYYERIRRLISLVLLFVLCMHLMEIHRLVTEVIVLLLLALVVIKYVYKITVNS